MAQSWEHMQKGLYKILMRDKSIRLDAFDEVLTPEKFCRNYIFPYHFLPCYSVKYDCSGILGMIRRIIY